MLADLGKKLIQRLHPTVSVSSHPRPPVEPPEDQCPLQQTLPRGQQEVGTVAVRVVAVVAVVVAVVAVVGVVAVVAVVVVVVEEVV